MGRSPRLFVISGPSGAGKGTLVSLVRQADPSLGLTVSATTRPPRPGEVDGVSYHFMDEGEFARRVAAGEFLEWADVHGHRYGTLKADVEAILGQGRSVILEIDVVGALNVRRLMPQAVLIFVEPPSMAELERRLRARHTEDEAEVELRLRNARRELEHAASYDVRIVNDDCAAAARDLASVLNAYEMDGGDPHHGSNQARD
ncbi:MULTISPECIES: guanylate kinase [Olsenella]|uniref:guanylate kinase n=1 Tax=Olsenella TaxID=133925 RepID=UPI00071C7A0F|nr:MULTISPECIES: guanylate kinase [Olsenella]OFK24633.1 guanylate kinase [Olsenella sp. HMSC062G07]